MAGSAAGQAHRGWRPRRTDLAVGTRFAPCAQGSVELCLPREERTRQAGPEGSIVAPDIPPAGN